MIANRVVLFHELKMDVGSQDMEWVLSLSGETSDKESIGPEIMIKAIEKITKLINLTRGRIMLSQVGLMNERGNSGLEISWPSHSPELSLELDEMLSLANKININHFMYRNKIIGSKYSWLMKNNDSERLMSLYRLHASKLVDANVNVLELLKYEEKEELNMEKQIQFISLVSGIETKLGIGLNNLDQNSARQVHYKKKLLKINMARTQINIILKLCDLLKYPELMEIKERWRPAIKF